MHSTGLWVRVSAHGGIATTDSNSRHPPPPTRRRRAWDRAWRADLSLTWALVGAEGGHLAAAAGPAVLVAACVAAWAAALGGAAPAAGSPLGLPGASALLVAAVIEAAALCVAWERAGAAAARYAAGWQTLVARGASQVQVALLLTLTGLPLTLGGLASGAVAGAAARAVAWAVLHVAPGGHAPALLLGMAGGFGVAACASAGVAAAVLGRPRHHRQTGGTWAARVPLDLALLLLGGYVALRTLHLAMGSAAAAAGVGSGLPSGAFSTVAAAPPPPPPFPEWVVAGGGALLLWGAAMCSGRLVSWAVSAALALLQPRLAPLPLMAAHAIARAARPLRLLLVPALATAALAYSVAGAAGAIRTGAYLRTVQVGGDVQIQVTWPGCAGCGVPAVNELGQGIPGVAAAAPLMAADGVVATVTGSVGATLIGVPPGLGAAAVWPHGMDGPRLASLLAASPYAAVLSTPLAARLGLRVGDRFAIPGIAYFTVAATSPVWPVDGSPGGDWVAIPWLLFSQTTIASVGGPISAAVVVRPLRGVSPAAIAAAVQTEARVDWLQLLVAEPLTTGTITAAQVSAAVQDGRVASLLSGAYPKMKRAQIEATAAAEPSVSRVLTRALPPAASRRVPLSLAPLAMSALLLLAWGVTTSPEGSDGLPAGDGLAAIGAASETARARRALRLWSAWAGVVAGIGAGVAAAAMFWPSLLLLAPTVYVGFRAVWAPAWVGVAAGVGAVAAAAAWAAQRNATDAVVAARLNTGLDAPPPSESAEPVGSRLARVAASLRSWSATAFRPGRTGLAVLALAVRRLGAARGRVAALAGGLLIAATVAATVPLFAEGAMTRVLRSFNLQTIAFRPDGAVLLTYSPPQGPVRTSALTRLASVAADAGRDAGVRSTPPVPYLESAMLSAAPLGAAPGNGLGFVSIDALPDLAAHAQWLQGAAPAAAPEADGTIDVAATAGTMAGMGAGAYQLGKVYVLTPQFGGTSIRVRITGVFAERDPGDTYWPYRYFDQDMFVPPSVLQDLAVRRGSIPLQEAAWYTTLDFRSLAADQVPAVLRGLQRLDVQTADAATGARIAISPAAALQRFLSQELGLVTLLRFASLPVFCLVLYFVAITAGVVVDAEAEEIAALASRGASVGQLLAIYLAEWCVLALPLTAAAVPLGALFARAVGASVGFLRFTGAGGPLPVVWQGRDFAYAGAAALLAVGAALVPVLVQARRSIVEAHSRASRVPLAPLWQRAYLDLAALALLAVAWAELRGGGAQSGEGLVGPAAIYVLPAFFIIAVGLVAVRALGALLRLLDRRIGGGAPLAVSLPLRRVGRLPAQFTPLLVLLCLTAALGTFSAAAARTLQANLGAEVHYTVGADLRLVETSPCSVLPKLPPVCARYGSSYGPDTAPPRALPPFRLNTAQPGVAAASEMLQISVTADPGAHGTSATLVLVDPATFARTAWWGPRLDPEPEAAYLGLLRGHPDGAFLSPDLSARLPPSPSLIVQIAGFGSAEVGRLGVVPRWPGADVGGPMIVATPAIERSLGIACPVLLIPPAPRPPPIPTTYCPVWRVALVRLTPGASPSVIASGLTSAGMAISRSDLASAEVRTAERGPQWAGQSGMLSVGFLVALGLAAAGYLLYAWLLLHGQLAQFGLLRAVGIDRRLLVQAVAAEQGMLVTAGAAAGVLAGIAASWLFVPLYQPEFTGSGGPPFVAAGPGSAVVGLVVVLLVLLALAVALLLAMLTRLHIGETVKLDL